MAQDPNLPKIKIGAECRDNAQPLARTLEDLIKATYISGGLIGLARTFGAVESAKKHLTEAESNGIIGDKEAGEIRSLLGSVPPKFPTTQKEIDAVKDFLANSKKAAELTLDALLNFAVDCECREAKAMEAQRSEEALQTVIEGKGERDGRPRRYTEIPGKEEGE